MSWGRPYLCSGLSWASLFTNAINITHRNSSIFNPKARSVDLFGWSEEWAGWRRWEGNHLSAFGICKSGRIGKKRKCGESNGKAYPQGRDKVSREQVICWQQKEVVGKSRNHSVDETNNIQSSRGVDFLKAPKCSWQTWKKPPVSFFPTCSFFFFFFKMPSYLTFLD